MFDSVLGRGVAAPGRAGTGAVLSLGLHALGLALALVVSARATGPTPLPIKPIVFPPGPKPTSAPAPPRPVSPTRPDRIRPRTETPVPPVAPEITRAAAGTGTELDAAPDTDPLAPEGTCRTPPCAETASGSPGTDTLETNRVSLPRLLSGPEPVYPAEAARARIGGTALVRCTVTVEGTLEDCVVLRSLPLLDAPVLRALRARRYQPAMSEGRPVPVRLVFTVKVVPPP